MASSPQPFNFRTSIWYRTFYDNLKHLETRQYLHLHYLTELSFTYFRQFHGRATQLQSLIRTGRESAFFNFKSLFPTINCCVFCNLAKYFLQNIIHIIRNNPAGSVLMATILWCYNSTFFAKCLCKVFGRTLNKQISCKQLNVKSVLIDDSWKCYSCDISNLYNRNTNVFSRTVRIQKRVSWKGFID